MTAQAERCPPGTGRRFALVLLIVAWWIKIMSGIGVMRDRYDAIGHLAWNDDAMTFLFGFPLAMLALDILLVSVLMRIPKAVTVVLIVAQCLAVLAHTALGTGGV